MNAPHTPDHDAARPPYPVDDHGNDLRLPPVFRTCADEDAELAEATAQTGCR